MGDLADFKNPATASAAWWAVRKKLVLNASSSRLSAREVELVGLAFQSLKDGCIIQVSLKTHMVHSKHLSKNSLDVSVCPHGMCSVIVAGFVPRHATLVHINGIMQELD